MKNRKQAKGKKTNSDKEKTSAQIDLGITKLFCSFSFHSDVSASSENENVKSAKMSTMSKLVNVLIHLTLALIAGLIIVRTVKSAGIILYTLHPVFMSIGVSLSISYRYHNSRFFYRSIWYWCRMAFSRWLIRTFSRKTSTTKSGSRLIGWSRRLPCF